MTFFWSWLGRIPGRGRQHFRLPIFLKIPCFMLGLCPICKALSGKQGTSNISKRYWLKSQGVRFWFLGRYIPEQLGNLSYDHGRTAPYWALRKGIRNHVVFWVSFEKIGNKTYMVCHCKVI